jgi:hypothetical protein
MGSAAYIIVPTRRDGQPGATGNILENNARSE